VLHRLLPIPNHTESSRQAAILRVQTDCSVTDFATLSDA
jgi:hypothetical protein